MEIVEVKKLVYKTILNTAGYRNYVDVGEVWSKLKDRVTRREFESALLQLWLTHELISLDYGLPLDLDEYCNRLGITNEEYFIEIDGRKMCRIRLG